MAGRLDGKAVIITGAASGQGRVAAQLFAIEGASLVLADADGEGLAESIATLSGAGSEPVAVIGDLTQEAENERLAKARSMPTGV